MQACYSEHIYFIGRISSERLSNGDVNLLVKYIENALKILENPTGLLLYSEYLHGLLVPILFSIRSTYIYVRCMHVSSFKYRAKHVRMIEILGTNSHSVVN